MGKGVPDLILLSHSEALRYFTEEELQAMAEEAVTAAEFDPTSVEIPELRNKGQKYAPDSTNVRLCTYDAEKRLLLVDFLKGGVYLYTDVPELVWRDLLAFPSAGQYLAKSVKPHFKFHRIDTENKVEDAQDLPVGEDRGEDAQSTKGE